MADNIRIRRGPKSKLPVLGLGEPGLTTDPDDLRLYIGGVNGNIKIPNMTDVNDVNSKLDNIKNNYYSLYDSVSIEEGTDLNNLGIGNYVCPGSTVGKTLLNTPTQGGFTLKVERNTGEIANYIMQTISTIGTPPNVYKRTKNNATWGTWYKVAFIEDSGWLDLPLSSGISSLSGHTCQYRKIGNVVYFKGLITGFTSTGSSVVIATLPAGYRPFAAGFYACPKTTDDANIANIGITTSGMLLLKGTSLAVAASQAYALSGISFTVN